MILDTVLFNCLMNQERDRFPEIFSPESVPEYATDVLMWNQPPG